MVAEVASITWCIYQEQGKVVSTDLFGYIIPKRVVVGFYLAPAKPQKKLFGIGMSCKSLLAERALPC